MFRSCCSVARLLVVSWLSASMGGRSVGCILCVGCACVRACLFECAIGVGGRCWFGVAMVWNWLVGRSDGRYRCFFFIPSLVFPPLFLSIFPPVTAVSYIIKYPLFFPSGPSSERVVLTFPCSIRQITPVYQHHPQIPSFLVPFFDTCFLLSSPSYSRCRLVSSSWV